MKIREFEALSDDERLMACAYFELHFPLIQEIWDSLGLTAVDGVCRRRICEHQKLTKAFVEKIWSELDPDTRRLILIHQDPTIVGDLLVKTRGELQ